MTRRSQTGSSLRFAWLAGLVALLGVAGCPKKTPPAPPMVVDETPTPTPEAPADDDTLLRSGVPEPEILQPELLPEMDCFRPIRFDLDSSTIGVEGTAVLKRAIVCLARNVSWQISIEGHADERGGTEYNIALGERRARAVADYLRAGLIDRKRMTTVSFGEERPLNRGHDETAWAENRRVEIRLVAK